MDGIHNLWLFIVSGLLLNMLPGPDSLLIIGRSASQGFKAGSAAALGIGTGTLIHIFAAAFGLSAILATSATAFTIIKYIGAAYLLYIAISMLRTSGENTETERKFSTSVVYGRIFRQGFLTNILNPKIALFFLAFMPQFIDPAVEDKALSFIILGLIFNINGMLWCHFLAVVSAYTGKKVKQNKKITQFLTWGASGLFGYFGIRLAFVD
ncbi:LysE family translocator [Kordiimonas laminariae]|uniref:LysE family translocator n=1 Tax=Kordiimonas laminariae TaxID=2917717 RepID=UPI001FF4C803|nr:LysE family translocator [Kordiimonas laminariae]MCK0068141.1 LysE family translocator [Kordiimonas laminariae]